MRNPTPVVWYVACRMGGGHESDMYLAEFDRDGLTNDINDAMRFRSEAEARAEAKRWPWSAMIRRVSLVVVDVCLAMPRRAEDDDEARRMEGL